MFSKWDKKIHGSYLLVKQFSAFFVVSGLGWLLDFSLFLLLIKFAFFQAFYANFISSLAAVTFVYFVSTTTIFNKTADGKLFFLVLFWLYQIFSIYLFSLLLKGAIAFLHSDMKMSLDVNAAAKILVTPLNLITNFIFMKVLVFFMKK